jgi:hypothetical protein
MSGVSPTFPLHWYLRPLTGALGLITTLGGPCLFGVPGPEELAGLTFMVELNRSGADSVL